MYHWFRTTIPILAPERTTSARPVFKSDEMLIGGIYLTLLAAGVHNLIKDLEPDLRGVKLRILAVPTNHFSASGSEFASSLRTLFPFELQPSADHLEPMSVGAPRCCSSAKSVLYIFLLWLDVRIPAEWSQRWTSCATFRMLGCLWEH